MAGYSEVAPKNATHESNSFFNQCAESNLQTLSHKYNSNLTRALVPVPKQTR